jgi:hypothetical protein
MRLSKPNRRAGVAAVILAALTGSAAAQETHTDCTHLMAHPAAVVVYAGTDVIVLAPHPAAWATLCYHNSAATGTRSGAYTLDLDGIEVSVDIHISGGGPETATIIAPAGYVVWPADAAVLSVPDGEAASVQLFSGMM